MSAPDLLYGSRQCTQSCSPAALVCHCITVSYISRYVIIPIFLPGAKLPCCGTSHCHSQSSSESHSEVSELDIACTYVHALARMFMLYASFKCLHAHKFTGDLARTHAASPNIAKCCQVHNFITCYDASQSSQCHTGKRCKKVFTWVQNFPRETRHGGVEDLSRRVTC